MSEHSPAMLKNCASCDSSSKKCKSSLPKDSSPI